MRSITENAFNFRLSSLVLGSALAIITAGTWCDPAQALTFNLQDEYWIKAGTSFSSVFGAGVSGSATTQGVYQETATGGTPIITQLTTTSYSSTGFGFFNTPVPGEFVQNGTPNANSGLLLNGWESTSFKYSTTSSLRINNGGAGAQGAVTGVLNTVNPGLNGTGLNFQYVTGVTGGNLSTGTLTDFNLNSMQIDSTATASGFVIEGLRNGVVVDTASVSYNFYNGFVTFSPVGWTDIDTVVLTDGGWPAGTMAIRDINIDPYVAAVPELSTWIMMVVGFAGVGFAAYRKNKPAFRLA
jgi:hypothetical protein